MVTASLSRQPRLSTNFHPLAQLLAASMSLTVHFAPGLNLGPDTLTLDRCPDDSLDALTVNVEQLLHQSSDRAVQVYLGSLRSSSRHQHLLELFASSLGSRRE